MELHHGYPNCDCDLVGGDPSCTIQPPYKSLEQRYIELRGLFEFLQSQAVYDEQGDAWWQFCFSKHHKSFEDAVRAWKENYDKGGVSKPKRIYPISINPMESKMILVEVK